MSANSTSNRVFYRVKHVWQELDYAQRKLIEIQSGVPVTGSRSQRRGNAQVDELESLFRQPTRR